MAPIYDKVAEKVSIPLVKVDATVETELAKRFEIRGYPTLKFWKDGEGPTDYEGGRQEEGALVVLLGFEFFLVILCSLYE